MPKVLRPVRRKALETAHSYSSVYGFYEKLCFSIAVICDPILLL